MIIYLPAARFELDEAADFYRSRQAQLGIDFVTEFEHALERIQKFPNAGRRIGKVRRYKLKRFPYAIVYQCMTGNIRVIAVMHLHRRPGYWRKRLKPTEHS